MYYSTRHRERVQKMAHYRLLQSKRAQLQTATVVLIALAAIVALLSMQGTCSNLDPSTLDNQSVEIYLRCK